MDTRCRPRFAIPWVANVGRQQSTGFVKKEMKEAIGHEGRRSTMVKAHGHPRRSVPGRANQAPEFRSEKQGTLNPA
jgi:hypothetical protein